MGGPRHDSRRMATILQVHSTPLVARFGERRNDFTPSREINRLTPTSTLQSFLSSYMTRTLLPHVSPGRIRRHRRTPQPRLSSESITPVFGSSTPASSLQYPHQT